MGNKMSSNYSSESMNDEDSDEASYYTAESTEEGVEELQRTKDHNLLYAVTRFDVAGVQQALRQGANVNCINEGLPSTHLMRACVNGYDDIVRILLNAGADARWISAGGSSAIHAAILGGHLSTVEMLLNHDNGLLEISDSNGVTPLLAAIQYGLSEIFHFLLDRGASALATTEDGLTALLLACRAGVDLAMVRRLLAVGVPVDARDETQCTALHYAAGSSRIEFLRELIVEHNANMFAVETEGNTPFDSIRMRERSAGEKYACLIECYCNILTQEHGRLALHAVLAAAEYSFIEEYGFHPPLNPLQILLPLGDFTLEHFRILLSTLDLELVRTRDDCGKLPIHIACHNRAPVEVLALILEKDAATLHVADDTGALPLLECCRGAVDNSCVRFLVEHGGVDTLAARNHEGAL